MKNKILVTCFEPFGGESFNASAAVCEAMPESIAGISTEKMTLPVEFCRAAHLAASRARALGAGLIVSLGEARGRKAVTPELLAINLNHASIPDNMGAMPQDEPIAKEGAAAYFTKFPARRLAENIKARGVPSALSYSAGAYVCNDLYYRLLCEFEGSSTSVIFIHIPRSEEKENYRNIALAISNAIEDIIYKENSN
jgi:pyroglutamyl-peptidase